MIVKWSFRLMNSHKEDEDDELILCPSGLSLFALDAWLSAMEGPGFEVGRSQLSTWLHHLLSLQPWSICLIFLKLPPWIRLIAPNLQIHSESAEYFLPSHKVSEEILCGLFLSFPLCFGTCWRCRSERPSRSQAKKTTWDGSSEISQPLFTPRAQTTSRTEPVSVSLHWNLVSKLAVGSE